MVKCIILAAVLAVLVCHCTADCGLNVLSCIGEMSGVIGKDAKDVKAVCAAFDTFKTCAKEKKCNDIDAAIKDVKGFDFKECSAGMVQISIVCIVVSLIASFFTR